MLCPACGRENEADARFCSGCGARLETAPAREERKVVTILFADIVGSTAKAERLDPEDVRAALSRYYAQVRAQLERHGGTVEKFIGDAVMSVFGAPVAHEDDPERAVRAAFAIREALAESDVDVRMAVHTGEALVSLGARAAEGEAMVAGDVVNTAARLQAAAPVNGVIVGEATYRATRSVIEYVELAAVAGKGKSEPILVWEALAPRARLGVDVDRADHAELVGREDELDMLSAALARARKEQSAQLVTLVGVPGMGKSRLVAELLTVVDADPEIIWWRQGRCLPYGEAISFWALSEMVKAQAGVLETDPSEEADSKLRSTVEDLIEDGGEVEWVLSHLRPLVGLPGGTGEQGERFAAWRRLFEALAGQRPAVLVFEDLHWADDGLLDFVDHLAEWAGAVPLLIVCTARPELLERRPGWGGGKRNASTVSLAPLADADVGRLILRLLERSVLPADTQAELLRRAGGNPLYAEQYVRMLQDGRDPSEALPENVQGIIAARLDTLPPEEKSLLQDAAVIGKVFWLGAVEALGGVSRWVAEERLHSLERREFVRRERQASVGGEIEYAFRHVLVRDVAYNQIPRSMRVDRHRGAAKWIGMLGAERSEDRSEMLAHHYGTALELARVAGLPHDDLLAPTRNALFDAGERASALGAAEEARSRFGAALELAMEDDPDRPRLLHAYGAALASTRGEGEAELTEASAALLAAGDVDRAALAERDLAELNWVRGSARASIERLRSATTMLAERPESVEKTRVLLAYWRNLWLAGLDAPDDILDEALAAAERLGRRDLVVSVLINRALRLGFGDGDRTALTINEQAIAIAREIGFSEVTRGYINNASLVFWFGDVRRARELHEEGLATAKRFGDLPRMRFLEAEIVLDRVVAGEWDTAVAEAGAFVEACVTAPHYMEVGVQAALAEVTFARADDATADGHLARVEALAAEIGDPQVTIPVRALRARCFAERGEAPAARRELEALRELRAQQYGLLDPAAVQAAVAAHILGDPELVAYLPETASAETPWVRVVQALVEGRLAQAARAARETGNQYYAALLDLYALESGEQPDPGTGERVTTFFGSVGATRYLRQLDKLTAEAV